MPEWLIILVTASDGQRIAISTEPDGPVLATAATKEEALEQANNLSMITGVALFNRETDDV